MVEVKNERYEHDKMIWNECAETYEDQIVQGHPDVTAYEDFEHTFLDRLVYSLCRDSGYSVHLYDFGCGSGRLHQLFGRQMLLQRAKKNHSPMQGEIAHVGGIDFSSEMISLAQKKMHECKLDVLMPRYLSFDIGSAFEVPEYTDEHMPVAVTVCNSIGVMQGPEGAQSLFRAMRKYVEKRKGLAVISCYKQEAVQNYGLGNYESTMDVCGQPRWLVPDTYASSNYTLKPKYYKRAHDTNLTIAVDVLDCEGKCIEQDFKLRRDLARTADTVASGAISTYTDYNSRWYSTEQIRSWIRELWPGGTRWHIDGGHLDSLRGEPAQLAILDYRDGFEKLADRWGLSPLL